MPKLYGKEFSKLDLMKRVGDISQVAGATQYEMKSGKAKGVSAIDVKTGTGMNYVILPDRGLDIAYAGYRGIPVSFISKTGITSPYMYEKDGLGFLRGFYAGLMTTCGLTYMGAPCNDQGVELGLHGRIDNTPAEEVCVSSEWDNDEFVIKVRGKVREAVVFGENLVLTREITSKLGESKIWVKDSIENCGFDTQPLMQLYHCNFGFPLVSEDSKLIKPNGRVIPQNDEARKGLDRFGEFHAPVHGYKEKVFYHDLDSTDNGDTFAGIFNGTLGNGGLGAYIRFNKKQLPWLIEWKQMGEGDYVLGLEPSTWYPEGRAKAREAGGLWYIEPGEVKSFCLEIGILDGAEAIPEDIAECIPGFMRK